MLRFDQDLKGDPHEGVDLQHARLRRPGALVRRARRRGRRPRRALRGACSATTCASTSRPCSWRRRRCARRRTSRPAGIAGDPARPAATSCSSRRPRRRGPGCARAQERIAARRPADPALRGRRLAGLAGRDRGGRPRAALLRADRGRDHARPDRRRAPPPRRSSWRSAWRSASRSPTPWWPRSAPAPGRSASSSRSRWSRRRWSAAARCSPRRPAPRRCWWPRSQPPEGGVDFGRALDALVGGGMRAAGQLAAAAGEPDAAARARAPGRCSTGSWWRWSSSPTR